ncbi:hypothetical protein ACFL6U_09330 [Planctomycetota bacterium]
MKTALRMGAWVMIALVLMGVQVTQAKSLTDRIHGRNYPSVFQAWNPIDMNCCFPLTTNDDRLTVAAKHDFLWEEPVSQLGFGTDLMLGAVWDHRHGGLATQFTKDSQKLALKNRKKMLKINPNMVFLLEVRWRDDPGSFLPEDSPFWQRNEDGTRVLGWDNGPEPYYLLDPENANFQANIANQTLAAIKSGVYDGVMIDWSGHLGIIKTVRQVIGDQGLIIVNIHDSIEDAKKYQAYINGSFMELNPIDAGAVSDSNARQWDTIREALLYFESNFLRPRVNCLEVWGERRDLQRMRATTTLGLIHSDGYVLYADPNPLASLDHLHDWYTFWDVDLGKPAGDMTLRDDGAYQREFAGGIVIYNHHGNGPVIVSFKKCRRQVSNGVLGCRFTVSDTDGDIFVPVP